MHTHCGAQWLSWVVLSIKLASWLYLLFQLTVWFSPVASFRGGMRGPWWHNRAEWQDAASVRDGLLSHCFFFVVVTQVNRLLEYVYDKSF